MNIFSLFQKKVTGDSQYLGLFLKGNEATGFILTITDKGCDIRAQEKVTYTNGFETILQDIDNLIAQLEKQTGTHLQKTIFFFYSNFIDQKTKDVKKNYKLIIKNIVKNLELEPLGYIECHEAVAAHIHKKETLPLNGIIAEIDAEHINIAIYKGGTITYSQSQARLNPLPQDMEILLEEAKSKTVLPAKIVLYHSAGNEEEITVLVNHTWPVDIFSQIPKIDIITQDELYDALTNTFVQQISLISQSTEEKKPIENSDAEKFGFYIGKDVQETTAEVPAEELAANTSSKKFNLPKWKNLVSFIKFPKLPGRLYPRLLIIFGVMLLLASIMVAEFFFHKATIAIFLPAKNIAKSLSYSSTEPGALEIKNSSIAADYTETIAASGKRDVGEKAHGEVTVNSFEDKERLFTKGSEFSVDNLNFILDNDVKVASASVDGDVKKAGKAKATITALEIGTDYNLEKNKRFKIADLSSSNFFAINDNSLTGGSKKIVKTVAKKDLDTLKQKILDRATEKVPTNDQGKATDNKIIKNLTESKLIDSEYSKEIGEEANEVVLKSKVEMNYYYYTDTGMKKYLSEQLKDEFPSDFVINPAKLKYQLAGASMEDDIINLEIEADVTAIKSASFQDILKTIKGKRKDALNELVINKLHASRYELLQSSNIILLDSWMPFFQRNITLEITSE